jgi:hypothetical protein
VPPDVAALVSELGDEHTLVTLVNLHAVEPRLVVVQGGAYAEHRFETVERDGKKEPLGARTLTVKLAPGSGAQLRLHMKRYAETPTLSFPWERN